MTATLTPPDDRAEVEPAPRRGARWRPDRDVVLAGGVAVAFQVVLTVVGAVADRVLASARQPAAIVPGVLEHMFRWDALWYAEIPESYATKPQSPAFYPLFPVLVHGVEVLSFGALGMLGAALLLNTLGVWAAVLALLKSSRRLVGDPRAGWLAVAVLLTAPPAFFLHVFYTEAVFIGLGFAAYAFALHRDWPGMGLCLVPLTAGRLPAVLFVGLCFLEFWRARGWRLRGLLTPHLLWFPVAFAGFGAYALYLSVVRGDPLAMFSAYRAGAEWWFQVFDPDIAGTLAGQVTAVARAVRGEVPIDGHTVTDSVLPLLALAVLLAASAYLAAALRGPGVPLALFGLAAFVMFTLNSQLLSVYRYVLPCLSIYLAAEVLAARHPAARRLLPALLYPAVLVQGAVFVMFVANQFAG